MKKLTIFIMIMACTYASAQNINDVLLYSSENLQGTARFQAMGGAFGALGGDMSALNSNPAGSAVFNNSLITFSGTNYGTKTSNNYFGGTTESNNNSLDFNQVGGAFVFKSNGSSPWKKIAFALNYDMVQNFDNDFRITGNGTQGVDQYFLNYADGVPFGQILLQPGEYIEDAYLNIGADLGFGPQQAFLGYFGGIIDPVDDSDTESAAYVSNADYNTVHQDYYQTTSGYNSKFTLNFAGQYEENLYVGASLNFHTILYDKYTEYTETGYAPTSDISFTEFDNSLHSEGSGFSFSLGAIAKVNESLRVGASYQSPTWYRLTDDFAQRIDSDLADDEIDYLGFNIVNKYEPYTIKTPSKFTGSAALIFGQEGLLSLDYSYQDMSKAELRPTSDAYFASENDVIAGTLGAVSTLKLGGEYRIKALSLRGGYRFEQSPYEDGETMGDLNGFSAGLGYNFGGSRLDLAYGRYEREMDQKLFDRGTDTASRMNVVNNNVTLSYTLNF